MISLSISNLDEYQETIEAAAAEIKRQQVMRRIWACDHTVWKSEAVEIADRLGWLHSPETMQAAIPGFRRVVKQVRSNGYTQVILLGMGGSSLAAGVFRKTFGNREGYPKLTVLDSTHPNSVLRGTAQIEQNPRNTLFIVSSKSGTTVETISFFKYFYNLMVDAVGKEHAGDHFIAITDPGTVLVELAARYHFRDCLLNDPNIGGRYSALSYFGLLPAALLGVDLKKLLERAVSMKHNAIGNDSTAARLGLILGELAKAGRDKLTTIISTRLSSFGGWLEQLISESTGKDGKGILPVVGEPPAPPQFYSDDRLFLYLHLAGDDTYEQAVQGIISAGHPVIQLRANNLYDLGGQFFLWELATAACGHLLGINPFDQPDVEASKRLARLIVSTYQIDGRLPETHPTLVTDTLDLYGTIPGKTPAEALNAFLADPHPGSYIAIQAYLESTPENETALQTLRTALSKRTRLAVTCGYGPRYLHSTGQLHKGDAGKGLFIQITDESWQDVPIPDEPDSITSSLSFGILIKAQAQGDYQAMLNAGRKAMRIHIKTNITTALKQFADGSQ